jgi:hypothetical protein
MAAPATKQAQIQRAIAQMTERPPVPTIDFTQHALEDGTSVNTQERVVKDVRALGFPCALSLTVSAIPLPPAPAARLTHALDPPPRRLAPSAYVVAAALATPSSWRLQRAARTQIQAPAMRPPTDDEFFSKEDPSKPDIAFLKNHFYREGRLTEDQALYILEKASDVLAAEPNLLMVDAPITGARGIFARARGGVLTARGSLRRYPRAIRGWYAEVCSEGC